MVIKDFIPVTDAKLTTEKEVKRKPSVEELTTIESPGKPTSATFLEQNPPEKKTRAKKKFAKPKGESSEIEYKKDSILIITEKPQAAMKIASALGKAIKYTEDGVSYYEVIRNGKKINVASAVGHLFSLTYSAGQKGWPIFKLEWVPSYERAASAFTRKYYNLLKKLSRTAKEFMVATDFDVEGEVIGWNVLRFICKQTNAKRMKFSTLTKDELEKSFDNPLSEMYWGNAYAGETRHYLDWLYGINLSRALMSAIKTTGSFKILSIGRVQGPALKIIVDREKEIEAFKPEPYWQVLALSNDTEFLHPKDIFDKKLLDKFKGIKEAVAHTTKKEEKIVPPTPFDLTTLQRESYRLYRISPSQTLQLAQKLYLDGIISYPRTSSQKIPKEIEPKKILKMLSKQFPEVKDATRAFPIEGKKSDPAHPSIYPTGEYKKLSGQEEKLYNIIARRFIAAFSQDALTSNTKVVLNALENNKENEELNFVASGLKIIEKGWSAVYPSTLEENTIPELNGKVKVDEIKILDKETQPPKRYTPTSLLTLLEKKNLGTKATRSTIIDTLFERGYLDGTSIKATNLGMKLIESLEKYSPIIIDENLTRQLEEEMEKIQDATGDFDKKEKEVLAKANRLIEDIAKEFKTKEKDIGQVLLKGIEGLRAAQNEANILMPCPTCKKGNLRLMFSNKTKRSFVACSAYPECKQTFSLPPNALIKKSGKNCEFDQFPKLLAIRKGKRPWEFCFNPNCEIEKKKREEWAIKKENRSKFKSDKEEN